MLVSWNMIPVFEGRIGEDSPRRNQARGDSRTNLKFGTVLQVETNVVKREEYGGR
jgi:hypothetical protein